MKYPPCKKCGAIHGMGIKNMKTGEIEPIDVCQDCLFKVSGKSIFDPYLSIEDLNEWEAGIKCK